MSDTKAPKTSRKHALIDRANQTALIALSAAVAIFIFSLFAAQALFKQNAYNQKVIGEKKKALRQIKMNRTSVEELVKSYEAFAEEPVNIIGGNPTGTGPKDGDNPRIVLDSLPSKYDFPGFASSMEKLIAVQGGLNIGNLGGTDSGDTAAPTDGSDPNASTPTGPTTPTEITMPITVDSDYAKIQAYVKSLEASIRPIYINTLRLSGSDNKLQLSMDIKTFYQGEKGFVVTKKVVE